MHFRRPVAVGLLLIALVLAAYAVRVGLTVTTTQYTSQPVSGIDRTLPRVAQCRTASCRQVEHGNFWPWAGLSLVFGVGGIVLMRSARR
jgi:hypothetical protein